MNVRKRKLRYFLFGVYYSRPMEGSGMFKSLVTEHDLTHYVSRKFPTKKDLIDYYGLRVLDMKGCMVTSFTELTRREFKKFTGIDPDKEGLEVTGKEKLKL